MSAEKLTREQINEIKKQKLGGDPYLEKALPLRKPPSSLTQENDDKNQNSNDSSSTSDSGDKDDKK